ncbi:hypothetical protein PPO43_01455 [Saprospira sp. CCB-QB6]|uniref:RHS repeat protein n=1 Tax=Saprospira sp. CCB-QB6 TaxID=3023936 RepID=UPI002349D228|nr:hypothetical protein [Saprospira sp. CCB-QB6]WCL81762.1 hypothetical protein PPO43_01455 [Saprospira sp. CCB-QB6]
MKIQSIHKAILVILICLLGQMAAKAQTSSLSNELHGTQITNTAQIGTEDIWYTYMQANSDWEDLGLGATAFDQSKRFTNVKADAFVNLKWEGSDGIVFPHDWTYEVVVKIYSWAANGDPLPTTLETLTINYEPGHNQVFTDQAGVRVPNAHKVVAQIQSIAYAERGGTLQQEPSVRVDFFEDLYLETRVEIERYFSLDLGASFALTRQSLDLTKRQTTYVWPFLEGATSYDFEWMHISDQLIGGDIRDYVEAYGWEKASRVNLKGNRYTLELPYESGALFFRVRAVGQSTTKKQAVYTAWMEGPFIFVHDNGDIPPYDGSTNGSAAKNWLYSAAYAENGKRTELLSFADGTGRLRQSVTKDNDTKVALIGETVYDFEGRQALAIAASPSPDLSSELKYYENYNISAQTNKPYSAVDFDLDQHYSGSAPALLATTSGTAQYYSANQAHANNELGAYTPDGEGALYAQSVFDNQGRIKESYGVGKTYNKDGGHGVKYIYGTVDQRELDKLFGAEVGYSEHYRKTAVIDQNGQVSVSYETLSGQVIATALVGGAPEHNGTAMLDDLNLANYHYASYLNQVETIDLDLQQHNRQEIDGDDVVWRSSRPFTPLSLNETYTFEYTFNPGEFSSPCLTGDCEYELQIKLYDDASNEYILANTTAGVSNVNLGGQTAVVLSDMNALSSINSTTVTFTITTGTDFPIGSYLIEKSVRLVNVSTQLADFRTELEQQYQEYQDYIAGGQQGVDPTTDDCIDFSQYEVVVDLGCNETIESNLSSSDIYCEATYNILAADMSPEGQYFDNLAINSTNTANNFWLTHNLTTGAGNYDFDYIDPTTGTLTSAQNWNEVRDNWQAGWEDILVTEHPEYCIYEAFCAENSPYVLARDYAYGTAGFMTMTEAEAQAAGILDANGDWLSPVACQQMRSNDWESHPLFVGDPIIDPNQFDLGPYDLVTEIGSELCNYGGSGQTLWEVAEGIAAADPDVTAWEIFKQHYRQIRDKEIDNYFAATAANCSFLSDDDSELGLASHQYSTSSFYVIRIPQRGSQEANVAGAFTNTDGSLNIDAVNDYANANAVLPACGYLSAELVISESLTNASGSYTLFIEKGVTSPQVYDLSSAFDVYYSAGTYWDRIPTIQANLDAQLSSINTANNFNIQATVREGGTSDEIVVEVRVPATESIYDPSTGTVSNQASEYVTLNLALDRYYSGSLQTIVTENFIEVSCNDQATTIEVCFCEGINDLLTTVGDGTPSNTAVGNLLNEANSSLALDGTPPYTAVANLLNEANPGLALDGDIVECWSNYCESEAPVGGFTDIEDYQAFIDLLTTGGTYNSCTIAAVPEELQCWADDETISCEEQEAALSTHYTNLAVEAAIDEKIRALRSQLLAECAAVEDRMTMTSTNRTYHYTLYYYDAVGNLERTIPPAGVHFLDPANYPAVDAARANASTLTANCLPEHSMPSHYVYNAYNQVVSNSSPDEGVVQLYYDKLGRPIFSQDAQQEIDGKASYIIYDDLGRTVETGVVEESIGKSIADYITQEWLTDQNEIYNQNFPNYYVTYKGWQKTEVRKIYFDEPLATTLVSSLDGQQQHLRNRVSARQYLPDGVNIEEEELYSYDVMGNVTNFGQYYSYLAYSTVKNWEYDFDLISGAVHEVNYQKGKKDELSFRYSYDANNRLKKAYSSVNGFIWNEETSYEYYLHGPLRRVELGEHKVQGLDYVYTLNGQLKSMNGNALSVVDPSSGQRRDPGRDGQALSDIHQIADIHARVAEDVFSYGVHYHQNDYQAISTTANGQRAAMLNLPTDYEQELFNGNISSVVLSMTAPEYVSGQQEAMDVIWKSYRYDQLNRLTAVRNATATAASLSTNAPWSANPTSMKWATNYSFDANGNLLSLERYEGNAQLIDDFRYHYQSVNGGGTVNSLDFKNNQLLKIEDGVSTQLIDGELYGSTTENYEYDANGSLLSNKREDVEQLHWTPSGKLAKVDYTTASGKADVSYRYGLDGHRTLKIIQAENADYWQYTVYLRGASGALEATYEYEAKPTWTPYSTVTTEIATAVYLRTQELGVATLRREGIAFYSDIDSAAPVQYQNERGYHRYALSNFRGDLRMEISDIKLPMGTDLTVATYYLADVLSATDAYAYGWEMPGRNFPGAIPPEYGHNGMRKSPEIGSGHHTTYFRELDGRMGRWWSTDPITFPHQSPYNTFDGNPIYYTDASGASVVSPGLECPTWSESSITESEYKVAVSTEISSTSFSKSYVAEVAAGAGPPVKGVLGAQLKLKVGLSHKKKIPFHVSGTISAGLRGENVQGVMDLSMSVYSGGLGTSEQQPIGMDATLAFHGTFGSDMGTGDVMDIYTLNNMTASAIPNQQRYSATFGHMWTYNTAISELTNQGIIGARIGNFSFYANNDMKLFSLLGLAISRLEKMGILNKGDLDWIASQTDWGWTGGLILIARIRGRIYEGGYQSFTGKFEIDIERNKRKLIIDPITGKIMFSQTPYHQSLNLASTFIRTNGVTVDILTDGWFQHFIHTYVVKTPLFEYNRRGVIISADHTANMHP